MEVRSWPKLVIVSPENEIRQLEPISLKDLFSKRGTLMHLNWCEIVTKRRSEACAGPVFITNAWHYFKFRAVDTTQSGSFRGLPPCRQPP